MTDILFPRTGMNMVRVLERIGCAVSYHPEQTCCGQPAFNTGYHHETAALAERFIRLFDGAERIVAPSGSCVTMVKVFYRTLDGLSDRTRERLESIRPRLHEFTEFLVDVMRIEDVGAAFSHRVTLHDSCHALRELHIARQPRALLRRVRGLEFVELPTSAVCCGFGGTFAVKYADISTAMGEEKIQAIADAKVDVVTAVDSSCLMHIDGLLRRQGSDTRTMHIADILASGEAS